MKKHWKLRPKSEENSIQSLSTCLGVPSSVASLLAQRGIETFDDAKQFFRPDLKDLHDPFLLKDMDKAVRRILMAIDREEEIIVYGDYDVDGTTSVAMMSHFLKSISQCGISNYIPDRYDEGYGVSNQFVESLAQGKTKLVVALDCGIRAIDQVKRASELDVDFIICDHHTPSEEIPSAAAVLNPKRKDCSYPFSELCGCGVGFKLIQGILSKLGMDKSLAFQYLDLLMIAIGADIVPMNGENRILAFHGLKELNSNPRPGISAMLKLAAKSGKHLTTSDVVFIIAPRINAAGRIDHALSAVNLLLAQSEEDALELCQEIEGFNKERRAVDKEITADALSKLDQDPFYENSSSTVIWGKDWHKGVIGIVASRLIENSYKPTVVLTDLDGVSTGSARSIKGLDIHQALIESDQYLIKYGGHTMAAGLSLKTENLPKFREQFETVVKSKLGGQVQIPEIMVDAELNFTDIGKKFFRLISQFAPFGPKNMTPVFMTRNVVDAGYSKLVGETKEHLKLSLYQKNSGGIYLSGIAFKLGKFYDSIKSGAPHDIVYVLETNEWQGNVTLQLNVRDIKLSE